MTRSWIAGMMLLSLAAPLSAQAPEPDVLWKFETDGPLFGSPALEGGVIYFGSGDGHLYAADATTGAERWRFRTGGAVDSRPAADGRSVFALSRDGKLYAVDVSDGTLRWTFDTGGESKLDFWDFYLSDPLVHGEVVVFGSGDGFVYALDRATGSERWRFRTGGAVHAAPVADEAHIYIGGLDGKMYALRAESGEVAWAFEAEGNDFFPLGEFQRAPALHDGVLYVGSRDYHLYAIDAADGTLRWRMEETRGWIIATPLVADGAIFFGASDGQRFYAVDAADGGVRWSIPVYSRVFGSAVSAGGAIVFGGFNGKLLGVEPGSGEIRWTFQTPASRKNFSRVYDGAGELTEEMRDLYRSGRGFEAEERLLTLGSIPADPAVRGGTVYFGTTEGVLYAVRVAP